MKLHHRWATTVLLVTASCGVSTAAHAVSAYTITDLGTLGGSYSYASGINNSGQVVGSSKIAGDTTDHAFLYSNGTMSDIGMGSSSTATNSASSASAINNSGQVVGTSYGTGNGLFGNAAVLYSNGTTSMLWGGSPSSIENYATGINDRGQVVGNYYGGYDINLGLVVSNAILYSNGTLTNLSALGMNSARGINDSGQVVGSSGGHASLYS